MTESDVEYSNQDYTRAHQLIISACHISGNVVAPGMFNERVMDTLDLVAHATVVPASERADHRRALPLAREIWAEYDKLTPSFPTTYIPGDSSMGIQEN